AAAAPLSLGHHVVDECRLPGRFGPEDLDDAPARQSADAEGHVEGERPRRDRSDRDLRPVAHPHDRALAELTLDLAERDIECFLALNRLILPAEDLLSNTIPAPHSAPLTGAEVKGKQRPGMERTCRAQAAVGRASAARGTAGP